MSIPHSVSARPLRKSERWQQHVVRLWPIGLFSLVVAALNWPLVLHLNTHIIGWGFDDVVEVLWQLRWTQRALFELHVSPLFAPVVYYPHGWYLATGAEPVWWTTALAPLTQLFGPVTVYNLVMLACYAIAGAATCTLAYELSGSRLGGVLAGCIYISTPMLLLRARGHLDILLAVIWLPMVALWTHRALQRTGRARWMATAFAGVCLGLACLGHWQFVLIAPLIPGCLVLFDRCANTWRSRLALLIAMAAVSLILVSPFALITLTARHHMYTIPAFFPIAESDVHSASLDRIFTPSPMQSLWGAWASQRFPVRSEGGLVFMGYTALILGGIGAWAARGRGRQYYVLMAVAFVLALGPTLHWNDQRLVPVIGGRVGTLVRSLDVRLMWPELMPPAGQVVVPLPVTLLLRLAPQLLAVRVWARYMILVTMGLGMLAAYGLGFLRARWQIGRALSIVAILLVLFEGVQAPYARFTPIAADSRPVDTWLARQPTSVTLIEYPLPGMSKYAMYAQSLHGQSVVNGYQSLDPTYYTQAAPTLGVWPGAEAVDLLRQWGVQLVLVNGTSDARFQTEVLPGIKAVPGLCWQRKFAESLGVFTEVNVFRILQPGQDCTAATDS